MHTPPVHDRPDARTLQAAAAEAGIHLPDAAIEAFRGGRMIEAIKRVRAANPGLDLARAKAAMEHVQRATLDVPGRHPEHATRPPPVPLAGRTRPPTVAQGDPPGQLRWVLIVLALLGGAVWVAFGGRAG